MPQIIQVAALAIATLDTGAATMSAMNEDIPDLEVPEGAWSSSGGLDGQASVIGGGGDIMLTAELQRHLFAAFDPGDHRACGFPGAHVDGVFRIAVLTRVARCG